MIDRKQALAVFREYTAQYDLNDSMISHKVDHTFRVAENCERIAASLKFDSEDVDFAWLIGLLHDIGRFEQIRRYGTFIDSVSVDHAEFGADLLFREGMIRQFHVEDLSDEYLNILEAAIRFHNKLDLPKELDERTGYFCNLIRDADKVDIFRVVAELPFEERIGSSKNLIQKASKASDTVMACVYSHCCVPREARRNRFEMHISHCCLAFELVFPESRKIVCEQGFLDKLLEEHDADGKPIWDEQACVQLDDLRKEIEKVFNLS